MKNKTLAGIFSILGGSFGLQRFYLEDFKGGFLMIFLSIVGSIFNFPIATIIGFIEGFKFFTMGQSEFDRKYNSRRAPKNYDKRGRGSKVTDYSKRENPYKKTGFKKFDEFDLEGSVRDLHEALKINAQDKDIHFKLACANSLLEKPDKALIHLQKAISMGYRDFDTINTIKDLAFLRISPQFKQYKASGYQEGGQGMLEAPKEDKLLAQLRKLSELRQRGLLSEEDYQSEKQKLTQRR